MPIDDRTANRNYKLPNAGNFLADDVARLRDALNAIDADVFARYTKTEVDTLISNLIAGAPGALNTLDELAAALGDDANFASTVTTALANRYTKTESDARYVQGVTQTENVFTGNGSQTSFTLTQAPPTRESLLVTVDGVVQPTSEYSLSGATLTLSEAPANGAKIRVLMLGVAGPVQSASTLNFTQAGTGAVTRTVDSKLKDVVSVKDFGAVGNGVADDTAAIQAALNSGARQVVIPGGTYVVTSLSISSAVVVAGPGKLKRATSPSNAMVAITASDVVIDGVAFAGGSEGSTVTTQNSLDNAILVSGTSSVSPLSNITFRNCNIDGLAGFGIFVNYATNVSVNENRVVNCGYCGIGFLSVIEGRITGNRVDNITASTGVNYYGVLVTRDPSKTLANSARSTNCIISNNIVSNVPKWTGIDGHAPSNWIVTNNRVYFCKNGIYAQYDNVGAAFPANAQDVIISGNIVEGPASTSDSVIGIASLGASGLINQRIKITDNIVEQAGDFNSAVGAIHVTFTDHAEVFNNVIDRAVRVGLSVIGTSRYVTIADNKINGVVAGAASASYMYFELNSLTAVSVARNRMLNTTGNANYTPSWGIFYDGSATTQLVMDSNRMYTAPSGARLCSTGGVSNNFPDLSWKLESETIRFNYTTTGGSAFESVGNKSSSFRRLPDLNGTFILRSRVTHDSVPTDTRAYGVRGSFGSVYSPAVYRYDGTNVAASVAFTDITFTLEGIYWAD